MAKYDPLKRYLIRKRAARVDLTFSEIERIIGAMLPKSALRPQWWANESPPESTHVQASAWRDAGYSARLCGDERVCSERG